MTSLANSTNLLTFWDAVDLVPLRAFGGSDVADAGVWNSGSESFFVTGDLAAGVESAVEWFKSRTQSEPEPDSQYFLFLVGAPGNGKSHVASEIQFGLTQMNPQSLAIHHRKHEFRLPNDSKLVVVNDATIPNSDGDPMVFGSPLIDDINSAVSDSSYLFVNVNRGILNEELSANPQASIGRTIVDWLTNGEHESDSKTDWSFVEEGSTRKDASDSLKFATFKQKLDRREIKILVIHVDHYSMFEQLPKFKSHSQSSTGFPQIDTIYRVKRFDQRDAGYCGSTPFGGLLSKFFDNNHFPSPDNADDVGVNPIAANLENFRDSSFRHGFQNILRSAELVNSQKISYREMWGAIAIALLGNGPRSPEGVRRWLENNQPTLEDGRERLNGLLNLASHRTHQTIFGASVVTLDSVSKCVVGPVTMLTTKIDPAQDAQSGELSAQQAGNSKNFGWASPVLDAFNGQFDGESVLEGLELLLERGDDPAKLAVTKFDRLLDKTISFAIGGKNSWLLDVEKRFLTAWYGEYLLRLYALARGISAFSGEIYMLTDTWNRAQRSPVRAPSLSDEITGKLRTLLLPWYSQDATNRPVFLPLFNARTEPLMDRTESPKLVVKAHSHIEFKVSTEGDTIKLELWADNLRTGKMPLDFSLLREALSCVDNSAGGTESAKFLTPRIERFRSSMLHHGKPSAGWYSVSGAQMSEIIS